MEERDVEGVGLAPTASGGVSTRPDEIPDDVLAELDAADRPPHDAPERADATISSASTGVTEDVLAEQDADVRAANDALRARQAGG